MGMCLVDRHTHAPAAQSRRSREIPGVLQSIASVLQRRIETTRGPDYLKMASSLPGALFFMVAAMATFSVREAAHGELPPGIMSIHNDFPSKLYVQCDSDREHQAVEAVRFLRPHHVNFYPDMHNYWICTVKTTPNVEYPYTPVPAVWGKFAVYVRNPVFRACYPICVWIANADGLALIIKAGDKPTHIYSWSKQLL